MSTMTTDADVLRKAAQIIERDGWVQGEATDEHDGHCLIGALDAAIGEIGPTRGSVFCAVYNGMRSLGLYAGIVEFNDAPGRKVEEVTALLRAAAVHAEESA